MQFIAENRLKELLETSKSQDAFDSAVVRELFIELDHFNRDQEDDFSKLEAKVVVLRKTLSQLHNQMVKKNLIAGHLQKKLADAQIETHKKIFETESNIKKAEEQIGKLIQRNNFIFDLVKSCLPHITRSETAEHIRKKLSKF